MSNVRFEWIKRPVIRDGTHITQAYVWYLTNDKKVVLVSKDNLNWQLPGGAPKEEEKAKEAAIRELAEETGIKIKKLDDLKFLGCYRANDENTNTSKVQARYYIQSDIPSGKLKLSSASEASDQPQADKIRYTKVVSIAEAKKMIPWLESSGEFRALTKLRVL